LAGIEVPKDSVVVAEHGHAAGVPVILGDSWLELSVGSIVRWVNRPLVGQLSFLRQVADAPSCRSRVAPQSDGPALMRGVYRALQALTAWAIGARHMIPSMSALWNLGVRFSAGIELARTMAHMC